MKCILWRPGLFNYGPPIDALRALEVGFGRLGVEIDVRSDRTPYEPSDIAVVFGWKKKLIAAMDGLSRCDIIREAHARHLPVICCERGYLGDRAHWHSLKWDGLNGRGVSHVENMGPERWNKLGFPLHPWRDNERGPVLLLGQVPWDASVEMSDHESWLTATWATLKSTAKRPVIFRPHPKLGVKQVGALASTYGNFHPEAQQQPRAAHSFGVSDYATATRAAWATVSWNSTAGVESIVDGVPHFCVDIGSMAWDVSSHDLSSIETRFWPNRQQWASNLAWGQWHTNEIASGDPLAHLLRIKGLRE